MPDYSKGKIYCLRSHQTDDVYIGSTVESLSNRKGKHTSKYKSFLNEKYHYITAFEIVKYDDCYIELIENYPCENKEQLTKKEGEYIRNMKCVNKLIAGRTRKEYRKDNKEKIKEYRENNKERDKKRAKEYRENNKEREKERKKKYREENKEKIKEKIICECGCKVNKYQLVKHKRTEKHKEFLKNGVKQINNQITCECGGTYTIGRQARHERSKKHQEFLEK